MPPTAPDDHAITVAGPLGRPLIVFLHGTRLTRAAWVAQQDGLAGEYRTAAIDLPGHGGRGGDTFSLAGAASTVAETIRREAPDGRAIVVGLSLGGYVGMELAATNPAVVRGLVLAGATAEPLGIRALPYRVLAGILERFDGPELDQLNAWFFRARYPASIAEPIVAGGFWSKGGAMALRAILDEPFIPRLASFPGPTLILNGEWDVLFRLSASAFAGSAQDARRTRLAGALHLSNLDRPAAFTEAVRRFARSIEDR
jgi:pimeloyl-ACP methyl ester carboxylesterase